MFFINDLVRYWCAFGDLDVDAAWDVFDMSQFPLAETQPMQGEDSDVVGSSQPWFIYSHII